MYNQLRLTGVSILLVLATLAGCGGGVTSLDATLTVTSIPAVKAWQTAALIETDNVGNDYEPQIAIDAGGNAMAVWVQSDGTRDNIWSNAFK